MNMTTTILEKIYSRFGILFFGLAVLLGLLLWFSPAERTLGQAVKLVYLHGALVQTALLFFAMSLPVNVVALITNSHSWAIWGKVLIWGAVVIWLAHTFVSMITTYATWGIFIAWFEPRTRFTFNLAAVSILVVAVAYLVGHQRFSALVFVLLAGLTLGLLPTLGFVQHPLNPIGLSTSGNIQLFYAAILLISVGLGGLLVIWLRYKNWSEFTVMNKNSEP